MCVSSSTWRSSCGVGGVRSTPKNWMNTTATCLAPSSLQYYTICSCAIPEYLPYVHLRYTVLGYSTFLCCRKHSVMTRSSHGILETFHWTPKNNLSLIPSVQYYRVNTACVSHQGPEHSPQFCHICYYTNTDSLSSYLQGNAQFCVSLLTECSLFLSFSLISYFGTSLAFATLLWYKDLLFELISSEAD